MKWIYFDKKQTSISGKLSVSEKIHFTGTIDEFKKKYDNAQIDLCLVSRSVAVNPDLYFLSSETLHLQTINISIRPSTYPYSDLCGKTDHLGKKY